MPARPDIDAICGHVASYARREPWPLLRQEHLAKLLGPIPEAYGLDVEQLFDEVHRLGHLASMVAFLDESLRSAWAHCSANSGRRRLSPRETA